MNRIVVLLVSMVVALGSGFGLVQYVGGAEARAAQGVELAPILTATADVPSGTAIETAMADGSIVAVDTMVSLRPATAVTDPSALAGLVVGDVLRAGQTVVDGTFVDPAMGMGAGPPTFAYELPEGLVAVSFTAPAERAVADLIRPGDHVNLLVMVPDPAELGMAPAAGPAVVHIYQDLEIVAIGVVTAAPDGSEDAALNPGGGIYTVAVDAADAARLILLTRQYEVFVTLLGPGADLRPVAPIGASDALPAVAG